MVRDKQNINIKWLGEIPIDWSYCRFKDVVNIYTGNSIKDEDKDKYCDNIDARSYISSKDIDLIFNTIDYDNGLYVKYDDLNFKIAPKFSTLMCIEGGSAGRKKAMTLDEVSFVNKLCCFTPKSNELYYEYLFYFLNSPNYEDYFFSQMTGMIGGVSISKLKDFTILLPPIEEQKMISKFLNNKVNIINESIKKILTLLDNYVSYKQSLINEVVTLGLNKNVNLKDSGSDFIGEIPEHWTIAPLNMHANVTKLAGFEYSEYFEYIPDGEIIALRALNIQNNKLNLENIVKISKEVSNMLPRSKLYKNDLIFTYVGAKTGAVAIIDENNTYHLAPNIAKITNISTDKISTKFMFYNLVSHHVQEEIKLKISKTGQEAISMQKIRKLSLLIPPLEEQLLIIKYLDEKCSIIDSLIAEKEILVEKLEEYKKSLIFEYVTGKKEVQK